MTAVDNFWNRSMVGSGVFDTIHDAKADLRYLEKRNAMHPMLKELMQLWGDHSGQIVLDYGCGPGDDVVGFLCHSKAVKIIGLDVSDMALEVARRRVGYHAEAGHRVELIKISDDLPEIPFPDNSVDFIHCAGVLQHISNPEAILREFRRVLKDGGQGNIMVYQRDSLWLHLYVAYIIQILQGKHQGKSALEAFGLCTDGEDCPIARCYDPQEFREMLWDTGFSALYHGGYLSRTEVDMFKQYKRKALRDPRLGEEHKDFLRQVHSGAWPWKWWADYPRFKGQPCGTHGCFSVWQ